MRSAFRKEHKKVIKSQVSGVGAEEAYGTPLPFTRWGGWSKPRPGQFTSGK